MIGSRVVACKICGSDSELLLEGTVLKRHSVRYYRCGKCELVQTEDPHWLAEAYREPINATDTGYVDRNIECARLTKSLITLLRKESGCFVDYGGGYGLFVRMMRDLGFDFRLSDKFCPNLFARGFEASSGTQTKYDLLTAFEVFEHLPNPQEEMTRMLELSDSFFFSTVLAPLDRDEFARWEYLGFEHGQHVSFYTFKTLQELASSHGLFLCSNFWNFHLFSKRPVSPRMFRLAISARGSRLVSALFHRPSFRDTDYQSIKKKLLSD